MKNKPYSNRFHFALSILAFLAFHPANGQSWVTNGSASLISGNCYQLTPDQSGQSGNVFSQNQINLTQPFAINAVMNFGCKDQQGADGIVFIFAKVNNITGVGGGEIGYGGMSPSIAVEYDDYLNGWGDPAQDHMAIISNGSLDHNAPTNLVGPTTITEMEDCEDHCFSASWDPVTMTLTADLDGAVISYTGDIVNTIFSGNPLVYYGFSSGTGSLSNLHTICIGPPILDPMEDVTICAGESAQLEADQNGAAWHWAPDPTLSATQISDPVAMPPQTRTYMVAIDYPCSGILYDTVVVTVVPGPTPVASNNGPLCAGETLMLSAAGGTGYQWTGPMSFSSSNQNPQIVNVVGGHSGTYTVTVTDAAGCTATATTQVTVHVPPVIVFDPVPMICENEGPVQLSATPSGGSWSGSVSGSGVFDPNIYGAGMHSVMYSVTDGNGCMSSATLLIEVTPNTPALIIPEGPFCVSDPVQTLNATPGGGTWGDAADPNGRIYPGQLGPGIHVVTYTYSDQNGCFDAEIYIEILPAPTAGILPIGQICPGDTIQALIANAPGGVWGGIAGMNGTFDPALLGPGQYEAYYTLQTPGGCSDTDTIDITILPAPPAVSNVQLICNALGTGYVIVFDIVGGDPASLEVTGSIGGNLVPGTPYVFTSDTIIQGGNYTITIDDGNHCDPTVLSGSYACSCGTQTGTMDPALINVCAGDTVFVLPATGAVLDADDVLTYILHKGASNVLTDILASSLTGTFPYLPQYTPGVTYYVSAVTGNAGMPYGVDLTDPCLSVSVGTPVVWSALPDGFLVTSADICAGASLDLIFQLTGAGPFDVVYLSGGMPDTLTAVQDGFTLQLSPGQATTYTLFSLTDLGTPGCREVVDTSVSVEVHPNALIKFSTTICDGDSIDFGQDKVFSPGVYTDTLQTVFGCDSIIEFTLATFALAADTLYDTSCDPAYVGTFVDVYPDIHGCDSSVTRIVSYALSDTVYLQRSTCDPAQAGIFTDVYLTDEGCDSTVIETVSLNPMDMTQIMSSTCDSTLAGVFSEILTNRYGCDSTVVETIALAPSWMIGTQSLTCLPSEAGVFVSQYTTAAGCDSIVTETVVLLESDTTWRQERTCAVSDTGVTMLHLQNALGCDSIIFVQTVLDLPEICDPVVIHKTLYVPNVFSPNHDHVNDIFTLYADPTVVPLVHVLRVFNRWGALVGQWEDFAPGDQAPGWDGTCKGEMLNPGVFVWMAEVEYFDGKTEVLYGDVTLVR